MICSKAAAGQGDAADEADCGSGGAHGELVSGPGRTRYRAAEGRQSDDGWRNHRPRAIQLLTGSVASAVKEGAASARDTKQAEEKAAAESEPGSGTEAEEAQAAARQ